MFAVSAGSIFKGDEKNCEKLGSCALVFSAIIKAEKNTIKFFNFFIIINLSN
jgi:hypothetical protein